MLNLVTFSTLEGNRVHCEPKLIHAEPYPSRDLPVVHERLEPSIWSLSVCVCVEWQKTLPPYNNCFPLQGVAAGPRVCHQRRHSRDPAEAVGDVQLCTCNGCAKSFWPRCFSRCVCFMLNLVTFSTLEGNRVHCEPKLIHAEPYPSRDLPVVHERLEPSIWSLSVNTPFVGDPRVYPSCDPGPVRRKI